MPSPSSSGLMSLILMAVSCIADSTLGLQADDLSSSLTSESYVPPYVPLAEIEDGVNSEISNPNDQLQQSEQSQISPGCSSHSSNTNTNRRNRKLRLIRRGGACGWDPNLESDVLPSSTNSKVQLRLGTYLTGGPLSDRWGVCGNELNAVANSIPVCTPVNLGDITGDAITSQGQGLYTDILMARLYNPIDPCRANDPGEALYCCHIVTYHGPDRNMQLYYTSYDFSGRVCRKVTGTAPGEVVRPFRKRGQSEVAARMVQVSQQSDLL